MDNPFNDPIRRCVCGAEFNNNITLGHHWKKCAALPAAIEAEYHRLAEEAGTFLIDRKRWNENKPDSLPGASIICRMYGGSWFHFIAAMTGGEAVLSGVRVEYLPPKPCSWDGLLEPGETVSRYASKEQLYGLLTAMVRVASQEAAGALVHWRVEHRRGMDLEEIQADACQFIEELRSRHTMPVEQARIRAGRVG